MTATVNKERISTKDKGTDHPTGASRSGHSRSPPAFIKMSPPAAQSVQERVVHRFVQTEPATFTVFAVVSLTTLFFAFVKHWSIKPGGCLQKIVREQTRRDRTKRRKRLRDMLNDPVVARDMEGRILKSCGGDEEFARNEMAAFRDRASTDQKDGDEEDATGSAYTRNLARMLCMVQVIPLVTFWVLIPTLVRMTGTDSIWVFLVFPIVSLIDDYFFLRKRGGTRHTCCGIAARTVGPVVQSMQTSTARAEQNQNENHLNKAVLADGCGGDKLSDLKTPLLSECDDFGDPTSIV